MKKILCIVVIGLLSLSYTHIAAQQKNAVKPSTSTKPTNQKPVTNQKPNSQNKVTPNKLDKPDIVELSCGNNYFKFEGKKIYEGGINNDVTLYHFTDDTLYVGSYSKIIGSDSKVMEISLVTEKVSIKDLYFINDGFLVKGDNKISQVSDLYFLVVSEPLRPFGKFKNVFLIQEAKCNKYLGDIFSIKNKKGTFVNIKFAKEEEAKKVSDEITSRINKMYEAEKANKK